MTEANDIFFGTLQQYATDSTAGAAILAAVADTLANTPTLRNDAREQANINLRWFATRSENERVQIMALAAAVNKHLKQTEGRARLSAAPAATRLDCLQLAAAIYRHLKKRKAAVSKIVETTAIKARAAYKAVIKSNLPLINQMRSVKRTRNWSTIAATLETITGQRIPAGTLSKIYAEVTAEGSARRAVSIPATMTHFQNEVINEETRAAYEKAGYLNIEETTNYN